ncbi:MAG: hypothetical protein ABEL76_13835 [Bradymonadaceae bacterium]
MTTFYAVGALVTAAFVVFLARTASRGASMADAVERVRESGEPDPIVEFVQSQPEQKRPTHWDDALGRLWQKYDRIEAARVVVAAARRSDASILQFWIRKVLEVEPAIAEKIFTQTFLDEHYDPDVAARCGSSGCCS